MNALRHIAFWLATVLLLTVTFAQADGQYVKTFFYVSFLLPVAIGTSYFFNYYLVPRYLFARRYALFALYFVYLLVFSLYLEMLVLTVSFIVLAHYQYAGLNPYATNLLLMTMALYFVVFLHAFFRLLRHYYQKERHVKKLEHENEKRAVRYLTVRTDRKTAHLPLAEIRYIESLADYVKIHTTDGTTLTKEKISALAETLPDSFVRIHRSYLVHDRHVRLWGKESVTLGEQQLPVGRSYRNVVEEKVLLGFGG